MCPPPEHIIAQIVRRRSVNCWFWALRKSPRSPYLTPLTMGTWYFTLVKQREDGAKFCGPDVALSHPSYMLMRSKHHPMVPGRQVIIYSLGTPPGSPRRVCQPDSGRAGRALPASWTRIGGGGSGGEPKNRAGHRSGGGGVRAVQGAPRLRSGPQRPVGGSTG